MSSLWNILSDRVVVIEAEMIFIGICQEFILQNSEKLQEFKQFKRLNLN